MKTVILDENQYPFEIKPEVIKTNFALFQRITKEREYLTLILFKDPESADKILLDREINNLGEVCVASGCFSYAGDTPNSREWAPEIKTVSDKLNQPALSALQSDIFVQVKKCFKGENLDSQSTAKNKMADIHGSESRNSGDEITKLAHIPWPEAANIPKLDNREAGNTVTSKPAHQHRSKSQTDYPTVQPTVTM